MAAGTMKKFALPAVFLLLALSFAAAHGHDFNETKLLIDSGIGCDSLASEELEAIGEYYMEQMHPGEEHEIMDAMMGGEGSETLGQMHMNMALRLYCNEPLSSISYPSGMMGSGMMGPMMFGGTGTGGMMQSMPGGTFGMPFYGYWNIFTILYAVLLISLIALVSLGIAKLWKSGKNP